MSRLFLVLLGVAACGLVLVWGFWRVRGTLGRMTEMVDAAIEGRFQVRTYDESQLSRLEAKLARWLSSSQLDRQSVAAEKDRIKSLIGDISHQTRTPIANILLYAELLQEQAEDQALGDLANQIGVQADKLGFLVQSLVKLSRLESGVLQVAPRPGSIAQLLQAVVHAHAGKAEQKGIALSLDCQPELLARFDPKWTAEALENILDNAIKYTPGGGKVTIIATAYEVFCRLDITDTGPGVAEHEQPLIFQRFYRSPSVSGREGVGIGLFLSREIIMAQGGYIRLQSELGRGSTFSVFLPRE